MSASPCRGLIRIRQGRGGGKERSWRGSSGAPGAWYCFRGRRQGPSCPSLRTANLVPGLGGHGGRRGAVASLLLVTPDLGPETHPRGSCSEPWRGDFGHRCRLGALVPLQRPWKMPNSKVTATGFQRTTNYKVPSRRHWAAFPPASPLPLPPTGEGPDLTLCAPCAPRRSRIQLGNRRRRLPRREFCSRAFPVGVLLSGGTRVARRQGQASSPRLRHGKEP